jgi:hypothetical protein
MLGGNGGRKLDNVFFYDVETGVGVAVDEFRIIGEKYETSTFFV